ncbi:MAG: hypothetical protein ACJASM_001964 [Salibacteraceae bacterium]
MGQVIFSPTRRSKIPSKMKARPRYLIMIGEGEYRKKYPKFRITKSVNEPDEIKVAA